MIWNGSNNDQIDSLKDRYLTERSLELKGYWERLVQWYNSVYDEPIGKEAMRSKVKKYVLPRLDSQPTYKDTKAGTKEKIKEPGRVGYKKFDNGQEEYTDVFYFSEDDKKTPNDLLKRLGHDPVETELCFWQFSNWKNGADDGNRILQACKYRIKPRKEIVFDEKEFLNSLRSVLKKAPISYKYNSKVSKVDGLNKDILTVFPGIELHLGKISWNKETGDLYSVEEAKKRFYKTLDGMIKEQREVKAHKCIYAIGNDFFNSDSKGATTKGTPQHDGAGNLELFKLGIEMQKEAIEALRKEFNEVEVILTKSNHDYEKISYLYIGLSGRYENVKGITFREDYKARQCVHFGNNALFLLHGDSNETRTVINFASEFPKAWANSWYREAIAGHLHSKGLKQYEQGGIFVRRIGSPTGTDKWHYDESWIGAIPSYQILHYRKEGGVYGIRNIYFAEKQKKLIKEK